MKILIIFFLIVFIDFSQSFSQGNKICWNEQMTLTWNDYKTITIDTTNQGFSAISSCGIIVDFSLNKVLPYFNKTNSWVLLDEKYSLSLLNHERKHFDIVELFARKIRYVYLHSNEKDLEVIYNQSISQRDKLQNRYDIETNHGSIETKQKCWDEYIKTELKLLEKYKTTVNDCILLNN